MIESIVPLPQDGHELIPKTCEYVTLHGQGTLQMELIKDFETREYPGVPSEVTRFLKGKEEGRRVRRAVTTEAEVRVAQPQTKECSL